MMPNNVLSSRTIEAPFLAPRDLRTRRDTDYEQGGIAIQDASQGMQVQTWRGRIVGNDIVLDAPSVAETTVLTIADGIQDFAFTFDQNMNLFITYLTQENVGAYFYWFDSLISGYRTTLLDEVTNAPRCSLDDKRALETTSSDIILAYIRDDSLMMRVQRDRYNIEYNLLADFGDSRLVQIGMNTKNRFQFQVGSNEDF